MIKRIFFVILLAGCAVNPLTHQSELMLISESDEIEMGKDAEPIIVRQFGDVWEDPSLTKYVASIGQKIATISHRNHLKFKFGVLNTDVPNAFALPGGYINITRGLLYRLENEAQLAGVLGHEVGHVSGRHSANQMSKAMLGQIILMGASTYVQSKNQNPDLVNAAGRLSFGLLMQGFSREHELEADTAGADYIYALGYNPQAMIQVFEVLEKVEKEGGGDKIPTIFRSHPKSPDRMKQIRAQLVKKFPDSNEKVFNKENFNRETAEFKKSYPNAAAEYDKALAKLIKKDHYGSLGHINSAINHMPNNSAFYILKGIIYESLENYHDALENYKLAGRYRDSNYDAHFGVGRALVKRNSAVEAEKHLRKAISVTYQIPDAHYWLAASLEKQGKLLEAAREMQLYKKLKGE